MQAEQNEHGRPVTIGIAVPLSVTGNAVPGFSVAGHDIVALTLAAAQLGLGDLHQVICPVIRKIRQVCLPDHC